MGVDQLGEHIGAADRGGVQTVAPDHGQIGPLARLDTTCLALQSKSPGAAHGCHVEDGAGGHGPGPGRGLVDQGGQAHLLEPVEAVVGRRAVGAQSHIQAVGQIAGHRGEPRRQLEVGGRAVADVGPVATGQLPLAVAQPHRVGHHQPRRQRPPRRQSLQVAALRRGAQQVGLGPVLVHVGVEPQVGLVGQRHAAAPRLDGGVAGAAGRQRHPQPPAGSPVPRLEQVHLVGPGRVGVGDLHLGAGLVAVHQGLADGGPDAELLGRLEGGAGVAVRLDRERGGGAAGEQLGHRQHGRRVQRPVVVGLLQGPHPQAQPVDHVHVVGQAPQQRLAQVHVGLHQAGDHQAAGGVDLVGG